MIPSKILSTVQEKGIILTANKDRLVYKAPPGSMTNDLKEEIRKNKPAIIDFLHSNAGCLIVPPSIVTKKRQQEPPKKPCYICSSNKWWRKKDRSGPWVCPLCHPPPFDQNDIEHFSVQ